MLKKFIYYFLIIFSIYKTETIAANHSEHLKPIPCARELKPCLNKLLKIPEIKTLIYKIQKEGLFKIIANRHPLSEEFGAFWDLDRRIICVDVTNSSEGQRIGSILFELHNAAVTSKYQALDNLALQRKITKENYIRAFEYLEYQNSLKASKLANKGIRLGIFPRAAFLPTYSSFKEHYHVQKMGGHSSFIGKNYDQLMDQSSVESSFHNEDFLFN